MIRIARLAPYLLLLAILGFTPLPLAAAERRTSPAEASWFIDNLGKRVVSLLSGQDGGDAARLQTQLRELMYESFDLDVIGRAALGSAWQRAIPVQQREYQELFALLTADSYARRLGADRGGSLTVIGARSGDDTADAVVRTRINRPDGTSVATDLRVRNDGDKMRIVDVAMDGVSMVTTQRDEFASVIRRKGVDGLISDLRSRTDNLPLEAVRR